MICSPSVFLHCVSIGVHYLIAWFLSSVEQYSRLRKSSIQHDRIDPSSARGPDPGSLPSFPDRRTACGMVVLPIAEVASLVVSLTFLFSVNRQIISKIRMEVTFCKIHAFTILVKKIPFHKNFSFVKGDIFILSGLLYRRICANAQGLF